MKKERHRAAGGDMIVGFCGLIENGKDGVYGLGQSFERISGTEEDIGPRVIEIEA